MTFALFGTGEADWWMWMTPKWWYVYDIIDLGDYMKHSDFFSALTSCSR